MVIVRIYIKNIRNQTCMHSTSIANGSRLLSAPVSSNMVTST